MISRLAAAAHNSSTYIHIWSRLLLLHRSRKLPLGPWASVNSLYFLAFANYKWTFRAEFFCVHVRLRCGPPTACTVDHKMGPSRSVTTAAVCRHLSSSAVRAFRCNKYVHEAIKNYPACSMQELGRKSTKAKWAFTWWAEMHFFQKILLKKTFMFVCFCALGHFNRGGVEGFT